MPTKQVDDVTTASPYVRHLLAIGREPPSHVRVQGWVEALLPYGRDNLPKAELVARYGEALRHECVGFQPACDCALAKQSPAARAAARRWAARLVAESSY
jgi:hypothetical protein